VLEGQEIAVIAGTTADDIGFEGLHTVDGGEVEINIEATQGYVGQFFRPIIGTLPLLVPTEIGNNVYHPKHIKSLYIDFVESLNITVDDTKLRYFNLNFETMDTPLTLKTDFVEITPMSGWDPRVEIVISKDSPHPFTIIGIGMNIEV
jgi:hypothetical protein